MPTSASGSYSLPTLRFQNSKPGLGSASAGHSLFNTLADMASGIREARIQGGGGGGGSGSISTGQIASFTACVGDVLATAVRVGPGLSISAGTHDIEINVTSLDSTQIASFTACVRDAVAGGLVAGNGITFSTSGHSLEIKTATLTVGQMLSFTANVGQAAYAGLAAGTAIVLSFNAATNVTEIRASITSGGGITSFTACVGDAMFPNLKAGTNVSYSFNAGTHQTEINVTGSLGAISSLTTSIHEIVTALTTTRYLDDYGAVGDGLSHPLTESFSTTASAIVFYPYMTSLTEEKDYLALLTALNDAPAGPGDPNDMVHVQMGAKDYFWGTSTFTPERPIMLTGWGSMEGVNVASRIIRNSQGHGIKVTDTAARGSYFQGFALYMDSTVNSFPLICMGVIREYNPLKGLMVYARTGNTLSASVTYEVRNMLSLGETIGGTFIVTGPKDPYGDALESLEITTDPNLFTIGETLTWAGGSSVITYISYRTRTLWIDTPTGSSPANNITVTGATSGVSAVVSGYRDANDLVVRAATILSGSVDGDAVGTAETNYEHFCRDGSFGHGILITQRCYVDNVQIVGVTGNGVMVASGAAGYSGNANLTRLIRVKCQSTGGNGIAITGSDANVVTIAECTVTENSGYGMVDNSFLGAVIYGNHTSGGNVSGYYFGGGASVGFGNYAEGIIAKTPLKSRQTYIQDGALDIGGTSGIPRNLRGAGGQITTGDCKLAWVSYDHDTKDCAIISGGSSDGGVWDGSIPSLRIQNRGDSSSIKGTALEFGTPWVAGTDYGRSKSIAVPSCRIIAQENGGFGRYSLTFKAMRNMGSYAVRARGGGNTFRGLIHTASLGTITSVTTLLTGASTTTFSDTISIVNPGAGVGAVLVPVIRRGEIVSVYVQNGGSGYTPTVSFATAVSMRDDFLAIHSNVTGLDAQLTTLGVDTNINLSIAPKGTGIVKVPSTVQMARTCTIVAGSVTASADLTLTPSGNGRVRFGEFTTTATTMLVTGYIEIRDAAGNIRKLAVVG